MEDQKFVDVKEAASILGVHPRHIKRMIAIGKLPAANVALGNQRRYHRILQSDLMNLLEKGGESEK